MSASTTDTGNNIKLLQWLRLRLDALNLWSDCARSVSTAGEPGVGRGGARHAAGGGDVAGGGDRGWMVVPHREREANLLRSSSSRAGLLQRATDFTRTSRHVREGPLPD